MMHAVSLWRRLVVIAIAAFLAIVPSTNFAAAEQSDALIRVGTRPDDQSAPDALCCRVMFTTTSWVAAHRDAIDKFDRATESVMPVEASQSRQPTFSR